jgi:hypothetical protein
VVATGSSGAKLREAQGELGGREGEAGGVRLLLPMGFRAFVRELYPNLAANLPGDAMALLDLQSDGARRMQERKALDEHYQRGIIATRDILDLSKNIWAIPAGLLAWTIDG